MKAAETRTSSTKTGTTLSQTGRKTASNTLVKNEDTEDDDEEEGRSAMVGNKRKAKGYQAKTKPAVKMISTVDGNDGEPGSIKEAPARSAPPMGKKKATSYLDEILAGRAKKRKKR